MFQILIVENDRENARFMKVILKHAGYEVFQVYSDTEALDILNTTHIDLIIMDVTIPTEHHHKLAAHIQTCSNHTPILILTGRQLLEKDHNDILTVIDDFMIKPVSDEEMLLRIKLLLKHFHGVNERQLHFNNISLDYDSLTVSRFEEKQTLPRKEFYLLYKLLSCPDKIYTRMQLMDEIWGMESNTIDTTVNVHINRLRKRFEHWSELEITTIRGVGYKAAVRQP